MHDCANLTVRKGAVEMSQKSAIQERQIYGLICRENGLRAKDIAQKLNLDKSTVNHLLYSSPLMGELCYQDREYRWHGLIRQTFPHGGLREFSAFYSTVKVFLSLPEDEWMGQMKEGCDRIGRSLSDVRGLFHSFKDCRRTMIQLFDDLQSFLGEQCLNWEIVFELRIKKTRSVRIYADVLVVTPDHAFSLEFKMKDKIDPGEVTQAAKYVPSLEIILGDSCEVIPVLVLTKARELYRFEELKGASGEVAVCSGDMLFNAFDAYLGFLKE